MLHLMNGLMNERLIFHHVKLSNIKILQTVKIDNVLGENYHDICHINTGQRFVYKHLKVKIRRLISHEVLVFGRSNFVN